MRLPSLSRLAACLAVGLLAACGEPSGALAPESKQSVPGVDASIAFATEGPLQLAPGEVAALEVVTTPPGRYELGFRLVGDSRDASLDVATSVAGDDGRVTLTLRAPSEAATFAVRATIRDGASADLLVAVSEEGFATLKVLPDYDGARSVDAWVASATVGTTCAALRPSLPDDPEGSLVATAPLDEPLLIEGAPVGPSLALVVRAGRYAWGCTDVTNLAAGTMREVEVPITNKPIDPTKNDLRVDLAFGAAAEGWSALLAEHHALMGAVFTKHGSEPKTLLATMAELSPSPSAFLGAAQANEWLVTLAARYATLPKSPAAVVGDLVAAAKLVKPTIRGSLEALPPPGSARFTLASVGALDGKDAGDDVEFPMTFTVDPSDEVHLGGALRLMPSRYLGAALEAAAKELPNGPGVADVLSTTFGCESVSLPGAAGCNDACAAALCKQAFAKLWSRAVDASVDAVLPAELPLKALGKASFDEDAWLTGFEGSWLGQLQCGALVTKVSGVAKGAMADGSAPE